VERCLLSGILLLQAATLACLLGGFPARNRMRTAASDDRNASAGAPGPGAAAFGTARETLPEMSPAPPQLTEGADAVFEWLLRGAEPYDPWREARRMRERMDRLFARAMSDFDVLHGLPDIDAGWGTVGISPFIDMREGRDAYVVVLTLPNIDVSRTAVFLEGRILRILAPFHLHPFAGSHVDVFEKTLQLPGPIDGDRRPLAAVTNGTLRVVVPKGSEEETSGASIRLL
jgi:HSP20 family molecular chaperone IbpA